MFKENNPNFNFNPNFKSSKHLCNLMLCIT